MHFIYCRGGDKTAPRIADAAGMLYGVRYDYTEYAPIYMLDAGLAPNWRRYLKRVVRSRPVFALTPDVYTLNDVPPCVDRYSDLRAHGVPFIGMCPKFDGCTHLLPLDVVICISIPSRYAGYLPPDTDILPRRSYHLLGGDPRAQKHEADRITRLGGYVISADGNKLAQKAAHGQVFRDGAWVKQVGRSTFDLAQESAYNIQTYLTQKPAQR